MWHWTYDVTAANRKKATLNLLIFIGQLSTNQQFSIRTHFPLQHTWHTNRHLGNFPSNLQVLGNSDNISPSKATFHRFSGAFQRMRKSQSEADVNSILRKHSRLVKAITRDFNFRPLTTTYWISSRQRHCFSQGSRTLRFYLLQGHSCLEWETHHCRHSMKKWSLK